MSTVIVSQARMTSTRLPGKVLRPILGKPLLYYHLRQLDRCSLADKIVVAITDQPTDDELYDYISQTKFEVIRGPEDDVLERYRLAVEAHGAQTVVRVTSDCPLIDPVVIDDTIRLFEQGQFDYVSNVDPRTFPRGLDVEVFSRSVLLSMAAKATEPHHREHVTQYIHNHPDQHQIGSLQSQNGDQSHHRWTVDTPQDFEFINKILESLFPQNPDFLWQDVIELLELHPDWVKINAHIQQKTI